jgi:hypothetical protein
MPAGWVAGGVAAAGLVGSYMSSQASKSAAQTQADAANQATASQRDALNQQIELQKPFTTAGTTAVNQLSAMTQPGGSATKDFAYSPFEYQADPGYAFRMKQGMDAMNATAAARGGLISGNALKAGQTFGQEMGSQEYQNSFSRYLQNYANAQNTFQLNRNNLLDPLKFLTNIGQAGASNQAANVGSFGSSQAANTMGAANATAAGQVGSANAYTSTINQGIGMYQTNRMLDRFAPQSQSAYTSNAGYGLNAADNYLTRQSNQASPDFVGPAY